MLLAARIGSPTPFGGLLLRRGRRRDGAGGLEIPDQRIDQFGLFIGGHVASVFSIAAIHRNGNQLVAGAPLQEAAVGVPVIAHVNAEVPRHAIEQVVFRVEPLAIDLPEHKGAGNRLARTQGRWQPTCPNTRAMRRVSS